MRRSGPPLPSGAQRIRLTGDFADAVRALNPLSSFSNCARWAMAIDFNFHLQTARRERLSTDAALRMMAWLPQIFFLLSALSPTRRGDLSQRNFWGSNAKDLVLTFSGTTPSSV